MARKPPWKKANPRKNAGKKSKKLSAGQKASAKRSAKKAGRPYPSLVDNMRAASKKKKRKKASKSAEEDPKGGLTAAGRKAFARRGGSHLKPGVTQKLSEMTPSDMRRKGSWAVRFYGRVKLPPLADAQGRPTRHALSAHAWGEPVPKTATAARRIAAKGEKLLKRYHKLKGA
jgi:hypothetical protein